MGSAVKLRADFSAGELRRLARNSKDVRQSSRLLSIAAVLDGMRRADAPRIGGIDRQTLHGWVHRFNTAGPDGLVDQWAPGPASRLSHEQQAELAALVENGPDRAVDGVVRWRGIDLKKAIKSKDRPEERDCTAVGTRPRQPTDQRYNSAYLFGAICPERGAGPAHAVPFADTEGHATPYQRDHPPKRASMPYSSWIAPDGTPPQTSAYRTNITPDLRCARRELNSVENVCSICARTGSQPCLRQL